MLKDTYRALFDSIGPKEETSEQVLAAMEEAEKKKIPAVAPINRSPSFTAPLLTAVAAGVVVLTAVILFLTVTRPPMPTENPVSHSSADPIPSETETGPSVQTEPHPGSTGANSTTPSDPVSSGSIGKQTDSLQTSTEQTAPTETVSATRETPSATEPCETEYDFSVPAPTPTAAKDYAELTVPTAGPGATYGLYHPQPAVFRAPEYEESFSSTGYKRVYVEADNVVSGPDLPAFQVIPPEEGTVKLAFTELVETYSANTDILAVVVEYKGASATGLRLYKIADGVPAFFKEYRQDGEYLCCAYSGFALGRSYRSVSLVTRCRPRFEEAVPGIRIYTPEAQEGYGYVPILPKDIYVVPHANNNTLIYMTIVRMADLQGPSQWQVTPDAPASAFGLYGREIAGLWKSGSNSLVIAAANAEVVRGNTADGTYSDVHPYTEVWYFNTEWSDAAWTLAGSMALEGSADDPKWYDPSYLDLHWGTWRTLKCSDGSVKELILEEEGVRYELFTYNGKLIRNGAHVFPLH